MWSTRMDARTIVALVRRAADVGIDVPESRPIVAPIAREVSGAIALQSAFANASTAAMPARRTRSALAALRPSKLV